MLKTSSSAVVSKIPCDCFLHYVSGSVDLFLGNSSQKGNSPRVSDERPIILLRYLQKHRHLTKETTWSLLLANRYHFDFEPRCFQTKPSPPKVNLCRASSKYLSVLFSSVNSGVNKGYQQPWVHHEASEEETPNSKLFYEIPPGWVHHEQTSWKSRKYCKLANIGVNSFCLFGPLRPSRKTLVVDNAQL